jgi:hypothetical protein
LRPVFVLNFFIKTTAYSTAYDKLHIQPFPNTMSIHLISRYFAIVALAVAMSSCYYSSPVPLPGEHDAIDATMLGDWEIKSDTSSDGMRLHLEVSPTGNNMTKGYFVFYGKNEDGTDKEEKHSIQVFATHVGAESLLNIGLDMDRQDGSYMFAKYGLQGDSILTVHYLKEEAFKKKDGTIERFKNSKDLYASLMKKMKTLPDTTLFEINDGLVFRRK